MARELYGLHSLSYLVGCTFLNSQFHKSHTLETSSQTNRYNSFSTRIHLRNSASLYIDALRCQSPSQLPSCEVRFVRIGPATTLSLDVIPHMQHDRSYFASFVPFKKQNGTTCHSAGGLLSRPLPAQRTESDRLSSHNTRLRSRAAYTQDFIVYLYSYMHRSRDYVE
jgi:hypothetical protein